MIKTLLLIVLAVLLLFFLIGVITGGPQKAGDTTAKPSTNDPGNLLGLAHVVLPKGYVPLGLADVPGGRDGLSPAEQLERHNDRQAAVFRFAKDRRNSLGGHALDPELLNVVLLNPVELDPQPLLRFSIERYYSPTGTTIPLDDPRWRSGSDARYTWRWSEMDDHFGTGRTPRWAIVFLDPARHVRLDLFVWRKRMALDEALDMLRGVMDALRTTPLHRAHFDRGGSYEERMDRLREAHIGAFFAALVPLGIIMPEDGGIAFGPATAAWIDADRRALRVLRLLGTVPGADQLPRDDFGRPVVPLKLKRGQYPGPTRDGVPSLYLGMLYVDPGTGRWHRSMLQYATADERHPLMPIEAAVCERLDPRAAYVVLSRHYYQPYALDDARETGAFLNDCAFWEQELRAGRIVQGDVHPVDLGTQGR